MIQDRTEHMSIATVKAAEPLHLAELIEDEMAERGWTMTDLVMNMGPFYDEREWGICMLAWELFFSVRTPDVILGEVMAKQLSDAFDVSPEFFNNLHENWRKLSSPQ